MVSSVSGGEEWRQDCLMRREMGGPEKGHTLGRDGAGQRLLGAVGFPRLQWSCAQAASARVMA